VFLGTACVLADFGDFGLNSGGANVFKAESISV